MVSDYLENVLKLNLDDLNDEQMARLHHHVAVSQRVFDASVAGMLKGVRKYGPEPEPSYFGCNNKAMTVIGHWLPHAFSDAVDTVNYLALMADALGVDLTQ